MENFEKRVSKAESPEGGADEEIEVAEVVSAALKDFPELETAQQEDKYEISALPFREELSFEGKLGEGTPRIIYLLESSDSSVPSVVVKVLKTLERDDLESIKEIAKKERDDFDKGRIIYADIPGFVPPEDVLIMTNPQTGEPGVAAVQKFMGHNIKDFFIEVDKDDFLEKMKKDEDLQKEFISFAEITLKHVQKNKEAPDILGNKNLILVDENGKSRLRFIDPTWIYKTNNEENQWVSDILRERLDYIKSLLDSVRKTKQ